MRIITSFMRTSLWITLALAGFGCVNPKLNVDMPAHVEPRVLEGEVPALGRDGVPAVMLLPAAAEVAPEYTHVLARLEHVLVERGLQVIPSGAVVDAASRVGLQEARALAENSRADILVQVTEFDWSNKSKDCRFFVRDGSNFREVPEDQYRTSDGERHAYSAPILTVGVRVMTTDGGRVVGSVRLRTAANWNLPMAYSAVLLKREGEWTPESENFDYSDDWWVPEAKAAAVRSVSQWVAQRIMAKD